MTHKRCRSGDGIFRGDAPAAHSAIGGLCSVSSSADHRRIERWSHLGGLVDELRLYVDDRCRSEDEAALSLSSAPSRLILEEVMRVTTSCLEFCGLPGDCFEVVAGLHPTVVRLLITYGAFITSECGTYLKLSGSSVGSLFHVAALRCAATRLSSELRIPTPLHVHQPAVRMGLCGVKGFGWYEGLNFVPQLVDLFKRNIAERGVESFLVWDSMLTDAGVPALSRALRWSDASAHHRYGVGITAMGKVALCASFSADFVVAQAFLLSRCGPSVVHCHLPAQPSTASADAKGDDLRKVSQWVSRCCEAPLPCLLLVTGVSTAAHQVVPPAGFDVQEVQGVGGIEFMWCRGGSVEVLATETLHMKALEGVPERSTSPLQDPLLHERPNMLSMITVAFHHHQ